MLSSPVSQAFAIELAEVEPLTQIHIVSSMPDGPDHPETWVFQLAMAWLGTRDHSLSHKERLALIKDRARELAEPARSAFTWIPEGTPVYNADISYWISQPWDNRGGRMTLVGDAAHPMPPCKCRQNYPSTSAKFMSWISHLINAVFQTAVKASITAFATSPTSSTPFNACAPTK